MDKPLEAILAQAKYKVPLVILTKAGSPLWLIMPYFPELSAWLQEGHSRHNHHFVRGGRHPHWELPKAWLTDVVRRLISRFGGCYLVQSYRELEKCASKCWEAEGVECTCSCMGMRHGEGHPGGRWYEISDTCAVSWGPRKLSYKLLTPKKSG